MGETLNTPVEDNPDLDPYYVERGRQQLIERERAERRDAGVPPEVRVPASERVPSAPTPRPPRQSRISDPTIAAAVEQLPESMRAGAEAQYELLQRMQRDGTGGAAAQRDLALARGEREAREGYAATQRQELARMRERYVQTPDFVPTQENALSIGTLFGLLGVTAAMTGTAGKRSAVGAMNAMSGMLQGWRQGRSDLYNRERQNFDVEMRRVQAQNQALEREFKDALDLAKTDMDAGIARAREVAARYGVSIAGAAASRQGMQGMLSFLQSLQNTNMQLERYRSQVGNQSPIVVPQTQADGTVRYYYAQRDGSPLMQNGQPVEAPPPRAAGGQRRGDYMGFNAIVSTAANEAAASIENLVGLSASSTTGIFQGRNTTGLLNSPLGVLANIVTSEDTQRYNVELANFGKFLAQVQRGGRAVPVSDMEASQRAFAIKEGDTYGTALTKLAAMRQQLERALEVRIADPNTPDELKEILRRNAHDIERAIPFTVNDVNRYLQGRDGFKTFADLIRESGVGSGDVVPPLADQLYRGPATQAFGSYDPDRYEYAINPENGNIRRRPRRSE